MIFLSDILRSSDRGGAMPTHSEDSGKVVLSPNCGFQSVLVGCFVGSSLRALSRPAKLKRLIETAGADSSPYFEALGIVLAHELVRLNAGTLRIESLAKWWPRSLAAACCHSLHRGTSRRADIARDSRAAGRLESLPPRT